MKTKFKWLALVCGVALTGCVAVSLHPLYTEKDLVWEPKLLGAWGDVGNTTGEQWTFTRPDEAEKAYLATITSTTETNSLTMHLVKLDTNLFFDASLSPEDAHKLEKTMGSALLVPGHLFAKVALTPSTLRIAWLDQDWLVGVVTNTPSPLKYEIVEKDRIVLTASTAELQAFIRKHANNPEAFDLEKADAFTRAAKAKQPETKPAKKDKP